MALKERYYRISYTAFKISQAANLGMLYEVSTHPAPGLVTPISNGAHHDMDYFTFLRSIVAITPAMVICAEVGLEEDHDLLNKIREVGIEAEREMFNSTGGINTQKGILFLAGVVAAAAGRCIRLGREVTRNNISEECQYICKGMVEKELKNLSKNKVLTNGERLYLKYGITGVRGEIEKGLPNVLNVGLPLYEDALSSGLSLNDALCHALVGLMTVVEDSTVINRCGMEGLLLMRKYAQKFLEYGGMKTPKGREYMEKLEPLFIEKNISSGGSADLLAITIMIKKLEEDFRS